MRHGNPSSFWKDVMPHNGEINKEFGIYESLCCGAEIVNPSGVAFPQCAKHLDTLTEWRDVARDDSRADDSDKEDRAA